MPTVPVADTLRLRRELLQLRAAADRLELIAATDALRTRSSPLAAALRLATGLAGWLARFSSDGAAERGGGWLAGAMRGAFRRPVLASLFAGVVEGLRRRRGRLGRGGLALLGLGIGVVLALLWRRQEARPDGADGEDAGGSAHDAGVAAPAADRPVSGSAAQEKDATLDYTSDA